AMHDQWSYRPGGERIANPIRRSSQNSTMAGMSCKKTRRDGARLSTWRKSAVIDSESLRERAAATELLPSRAANFFLDPLEKWSSPLPLLLSNRARDHRRRAGRGWIAARENCARDGKFQDRVCRHRSRSRRRRGGNISK